MERVEELQVEVAKVRLPEAVAVLQPVEVVEVHQGTEEALVGLP